MQQKKCMTVGFCFVGFFLGFPFNGIPTEWYMIINRSPDEEPVVLFPKPAQTFNKFDRLRDAVLAINVLSPVFSVLGWQTAV